MEKVSVYSFDLMATLDQIRKEYEINEEEKTIFLGTCLINIADSKSQCFQDIWALYEHCFKKNGFYVEIGANDGIVSSNTYLLAKKYNWKGLLIEPNTDCHRRLELTRPESIISHECVMYKTFENAVEFVQAEDSSLSTIKGLDFDKSIAYKNTIKVTGLSLYDVLRKYDTPKNIDYMSIDIEGSELDILYGFFNDENNVNYNIKCLTIEHNHDEFKRKQIYDIMTQNGYIRRFKALSFWDDFYIKKDLI